MAKQTNTTATKTATTATATISGVAATAKFAPKVAATAPVFTHTQNATASNIYAWVKSCMGNNAPTAYNALLQNVVVQPLASVTLQTTGGVTPTQNARGQWVGKNTNGNAPIPTALGYSGCWAGVRATYQNWLLFGFGVLPNASGAVTYTKAHAPVFNLAHITGSMHRLDGHAYTQLLCVTALLNGHYSGCKVVSTKPFVQLRYVPLAQQTPSTLPPLTNTGAVVGTTVYGGNYPTVVAKVGAALAVPKK